MEQRIRLDMACKDNSRFVLQLEHIFFIFSSYIFSDPYFVLFSVVDP
jgi:hypothetical protein